MKLTESPEPVRDRRPWHPTEAECRFISKAELERCWGGAIRSAARAGFPRKTAELGNAAYLGGVLTVAGRISEERVHEHLHRAAKVAGVHPQEAERVIERSYHRGRGAAFGELSRGGAVDGHPTGAFRAVASGSQTYDYGNEFHVDPAALLPLPTAALIHRGHNPETEPVGIAVPTFRDGAVHVDAVFASTAGESWTLVRTGRIHSVSILCSTNEFHRGVSGRLVRGTLVSVDLVRTPADEQAAIGTVIEAGKLSPGQRRTQRLLDGYLANQANPRGLDLFSAAFRRGATALDVLAPLVAPLLEERSRSSR